MRTSKTEKTKQIKVPAPFMAYGSDVRPTQQEINQRREKIKRAEEIGASITRVDTVNGVENPYRVKALIYINRGEAVPEKLLHQIKEFDAKYNQEEKVDTVKK